MLKYEDFLSVLPMAHEYGRYMSGLCPFPHPGGKDTNPSILVFKDGYFTCQACGSNGTWKTLWNKLKGQPVQVFRERRTEFQTPRVKPEDMEDVCYDAHLDLLHFPSLDWYLDIRGIQERIETNELGYWEGWYTIPVYDSEHKFVSSVFRSAPHVQSVTGLRYWCHHDPVMYVPDWRLFQSNAYLYVVFGMIDALVLSDLRLPVATSTSGKDTFDPSWLDDYRKKVIIVPDKGEEETAMKLARQLGWRGKVLRLDYPEGFKDPADYYQHHKGSDLLAALGKE